MTTYELKKQNGNSKTYEFSTVAAKPVTGNISNKKKTEKTNSISAQTRKKNTAAKRTAKNAVKIKTAVKAQTAAETKTKEAAPAVYTVKSEKVIPFPTVVVITAFLCTILFMAMIISFVAINEYTITNDKLEREVSSLIKEERELILALEKKNNLKAIEEYATSVLGMVKMDQLTKKYISIENEDKIEVVNNNNLDGNVDNFLDSISKNFKEFLEYIN